MREKLRKIADSLFLYQEDLKRFGVLSAILLGIFVLTAVVHLNYQAKLAGESKPLEDVTSFQTLELDTLDGGTFTHADLADYDIIVVDIWATWCFHCVEDMPGMAAFSENLDTLFPDNKVLYIGICTDIVSLDNVFSESQFELAQSISKDAGVQYPQLVADGAFNTEFTKLYATALPSIFYLDSDGHILDHTGGLTEAGYLLRIKNLLAGL